MNFFGHATVACWHRTAPRFVFGAMLPDFAAMSRARVAGVDHADVAEGMALHHRTDAAFHRCGGFRRLYRRGVESLRDRGLARGPAFGAAHVGVELVLDGALVGDRDVGAAYLDALDAGAGVAIRWRDDRAAARWSELRAHLRARGVPRDYRDPDVVARRVALVLSSRPRLRLRAGDRAAVAGWLREIAPAVADAAPAMLADVRAAL